MQIWRVSHSTSSHWITTKLRKKGRNVRPSTSTSTRTRLMVMGVEPGRLLTGLDWCWNIGSCTTSVELVCCVHTIIVFCIFIQLLFFTTSNTEIWKVCVKDNFISFNSLIDHMITWRIRKTMMFVTSVIWLWILSRFYQCPWSNDPWSVQWMKKSYCYLTVSCQSRSKNDKCQGSTSEIGSNTRYVTSLSVKILQTQEWQKKCCAGSFV